LKRLLIRPGGIGDFVLSLPALECLQGAYTEVWAASQNLPLVRFADRTASIASSGLDMLGLPDVTVPEGLLERLRSFDSIVSWYGSNRTEFREAVRQLGLPFRFLAPLPGEGGGRHAVDFYMDQARTLTGREIEAVPHLECPRSDEGFVVIQPFSGSPKKNWPLELYRQLAGRLEPRWPVRWCAGPSEPLEDAVRIEDLYDLTCWLARARLYIGNDSGITHLAAAAGTPVVALFGPTDPAIWAPRGAAVRIVATSTPGQPMDRLDVEQVTAAVLEMLAR
jgi:lipopolysaccharide heptosyltransferase III